MKLSVLMNCKDIGGELVHLDRVIKAEEKVRRYAGCMVGDTVSVKKSIGEIKAGTEVEILDIRCNDKQRILESDLDNSHIEVCKNAFQYKINNDTWTTYDKLDIDVKSYKPQLSNCVLELALIIILIIICIALAIAKLKFGAPNRAGLIAIVSGYLSIAMLMNLYDDKLRTNGTDLKIVKNNLKRHKCESAK